MALFAPRTIAVWLPGASVAMTAASAALVGRELAPLYLRHLVARNDSAKLRCLPVVVLANEATGVARTFYVLHAPIQAKPPRASLSEKEKDRPSEWRF